MIPELQIMTSQARMPNSMKFGLSSYVRTALVRVNVEELQRRDLTCPKQINPTHNTVVEIIAERVGFRGLTDECQAERDFEELDAMRTAMLD